MKEKIVAYILFTLSFLSIIILVFALPINLIKFYEKYSYFNDYLPSVYEKIVSFDPDYADTVSEDEFIKLMNSPFGDYEIKELIKKYDSNFFVKSNEYKYESSYANNIFRILTITLQLIFSISIAYYTFKTTIKPSNKSVEELNSQINLIKKQIENKKLSDKLKR